MNCPLTLSLRRVFRYPQEIPLTRLHSSGTRFRAACANNNTHIYILRSVRDEGYTLTQCYAIAREYQNTLKQRYHNIPKVVNVVT